MIICLISASVFLGILSVYDIRERAIPPGAAAMFFAAMAVLHLFMSDISLPQFLYGLIPGAVLLLLSFVFRTSLGSGDGLCVLACGAAVGFEREFAALTASFVLCALICAILLAVKKAKRSDCLPFVPFLFVSHIIMLIAEVFS